ncbi:putative Extracellular solute-binding protein, family 3 [Desulfamplus magnetovallimortis]|uniref:Putative Extracellular solute-binding protein, family 3 n=1 Tax=Desulfamplus magnetovallimortis TaxID=1246637 RepID=A0A1W1HEU9_9BACT|nr:transporter substrate-binding domain-containing protein [Desulfamplus magnetovallimortis]SLM30928.1 putative Extracellular solute-binding protein, family 3 [Desulfamplus magnetovallimortis]
MKHLRWNFFLLALIMLMIISTTERINADENKILFVTGEWPPFVSENLPNYGPASEIVFAACKAVGILPEIKFYPWRRAENMILTGKAFGAYPYTIREDRQQIYDFSSPFFKTQVYFFYSKKRISSEVIKSIKQIDDLKKYKLGGILGNFVCEELNKAGYMVEMTATNIMSIKKMDAGRIDFFMEDKTVAIDEIEKAFPGNIDDFGMLEFGYGKATYDALMVSRKYPDSSEILKQFEQGLKIIQQNGLYDDIVKRNNLIHVR